MAIEISFCVQGKETKQALFVEEADLDVSLVKLRKILEKQELHLPEEYKFLTRNGNAIAHPTEENIIFRDVIIHNQQKDFPRKDVKFEDGEIEKENISVDKEIPNNSQLWIAPLKVNFSSQSHSRPSGNPTTPEEDQQNQSEAGRDSTNSGGNQRNTSGSFCPYTVLKRMFCKPDGSIDVAKISKTLIPITVFLFVSMAILTFTLHVFVKALMIKTGPNIAEMLARFDEDGFGALGGPSKEVSNLQMKLSQLELSHKYELDQLTNRLGELEDLYLKDLDYHKRELNAIKRRMADEGIGRTILEKAQADVEDDENYEDDEDLSRLMKEGKRKYTESGRTHPTHG